MSDIILKVINSFLCSAQLMLNVLPLHTLLTAPFESLKKALPWIPENILKVKIVKKWYKIL